MLRELLLSLGVTFGTPVLVWLWVQSLKPKKPEPFSYPDDGGFE